jgi:cob(I)alamin adenosyltransferase
MKVYILEKDEVLFQIKIFIFGAGYEFSVCKSGDQYGIYESDTSRLIVLCNSYNEAINYCSENEMEIEK